MSGRKSKPQKSNKTLVLNDLACLFSMSMSVLSKKKKKEKRREKKQKTKQRPKNGDFNEIGAWGGGQWNDLEGLKWTICCCCRRQCCLHFLLLQQGMKKNECMKEGRKEGEKQKNKKQTSMHRLCAETVGISWGKIKWQQKKKKERKKR